MDPLGVGFWFGGVFQFDDGSMEFSTAAIAFSSLVRFRLSWVMRILRVSFFFFGAGASMIAMSPSMSSPLRYSSEIASSTSSCMSRLSGLAPIFGSNPFSARCCLAFCEILMCILCSSARWWTSC